MQVTGGLGESETAYSIAAAMYNAGVIVTCVLLALTSKWLGTRLPLISGALCNVVGYLLYGLAQNGTAIFAARAFIGGSAPMVPISIAYLGNSAREYQTLCEAEGRKCDKHLSKKLIGVFCITGGIVYITTTGAK